MLQRLIDTINASGADILTLVLQLSLLTTALIYCVFVYSKRCSDYEANKKHIDQVLRVKLIMSYRRIPYLGSNMAASLSKPYIPANGP